MRCVCSCSWVCVCEKHLGYICASPPHTFLLQTHPPEITGVALECVVRILSGIFHLMERTDLHSLRFESKHLHSQEEIANVVLLQRLKHKNTPARKETDPNNIFYSKNAAILVFINLLEYTPDFLLDDDCYQEDMRNSGSNFASVKWAGACPHEKTSKGCKYVPIAWTLDPVGF